MITLHLSDLPSLKNFIFEYNMFMVPNLGILLGEFDTFVVF